MLIGLPSSVFPSTTADDVAMMVFEAGATALPSGVATFGLLFPQGAMPAGAVLTARTPAGAIAAQYDTKTAHSDGSTMHALVALARPAIAAGGRVGVRFARSTGTRPAPLDMQALLVGKTCSAAFTGGLATTVDLLAPIRTAITAGTANYWRRNSLCVQVRGTLSMADAYRLVWDVTVYAGGGMSVDVQHCNDGTMGVVSNQVGDIGGQKNYSITTTLNGVQVDSRPNLQHKLYQNWHARYTDDTRNGGQGIGGLNIRHDVEALKANAGIAYYDETLTPSTADLDGAFALTQQANWNATFGTRGMRVYMPDVGGRPDIGYTTGYIAMWLLSGDARPAAVALGWAQTASVIPWHHWDKARDQFVTTEPGHYPDVWMQGRNGLGVAGDPTSRGPTQKYDYGGDNIDWAIETAHQPDVSFIPYLLTGERWMLDNLQAQAHWQALDNWPDGERKDSATGADELVVHRVQTRAAAWSLRQIENAMWMSPDGSREKINLTRISNKNWNWLVARIPEWTTQQGETTGYVPNLWWQGPQGNFSHDFFLSTCIVAAKRGNANALAFYRWMLNYSIGRFEQAPNFNPRDGVSYHLMHSRPDPTTGFYSPDFNQTWFAMGRDQALYAKSNFNGWLRSDGNFGQLGMSALAGVYHFDPDAAVKARALAAYKKLAGLNPPYTTRPFWAAEPNYAVTIPGIYGGYVDPAAPEVPTLTLGGVAGSKAAGSGTPTNFTFTATRTGLAAACAVAWVITTSARNPSLDPVFGDLNAVPVDRAAAYGVVSFGAGETSKTVTTSVAQSPTNDLAVGKPFSVTLTSPDDANLGTSWVAGTVANSSGAVVPTLSVASLAVVEGNTGTTNLAVMVTLSAASADTVTVAYTTVAGTATSPSDFEARSGTLTFTPGQVTRSFDVPIIGDLAVEPSETFTVVLSSPTNATIASGTATMTVTNDDVAPPTLAIVAAAADKAEGDTGTTAYTFTVTRTGNTAGVSDVNWAVAGTGANPAAAADFLGGVLPSGTVSFAAGQSTQTITVNVSGDTTLEADERFTVTLSSPVGGVLGVAAADGIIRNDDVAAPLPTLTIDDATAFEEAGSLVFAVRLSAATTSTITVFYAASSGSGTSGDFTPTGGVLTFSAGETAKAITVPIVNDALVEADETIFVTLTAPSGATLARATATGTIRNADVPVATPPVTPPPGTTQQAGAEDLTADDLLTEAWERLGRNTSEINGDVARSARRSLRLLLIDWTNRGLNLWQVDRQTIQLVPGQERYLLAADTVEPLEVVLSQQGGTQRVLSPIGRSDYVALANKEGRSTPTQYWTDRSNPTAAIILYPTPSSTETLTYWRMRMPRELSALGATPDAPQLWADALAAALAARLGVKYALERVPMLEAHADRAFMNAAGENRLRVPLRILPRFT